MGTFDPSLHSGRYFDPHEYVPTWFVKKWGVDYFWSHLPALHKEMVETTPFNVQAEYIKQASCIEDVPVHYYKLYKTKKESSPSVLLGIYHQGIRIHHLALQREEGAHLLDFEFPWNKVGRLFFAAKRFEIYPEDLPASRRLTYYTGSHTRSKYLLRLLRETHSLYMSLTPFVQHLRKLDGRTTKRKYRESYISGKNLEFDGSGSTDERMIGGAGELSPQSNDSKSVLLEKLYKSYTSSTSRGSSHTSGIESDSKQRNEVDDDDDDVEDDDAAHMQDNAFVDDFDPIELDGPPSAGVICVTEAHLEAPQHKSLSVSDLTEQLAGATVARESPSVSETTHSELTLKEEVFDFPEPTSHIDDVTNDVITEPRPLPEVVTPGKVILNSDTLPLKIAHVRESSSEGIPQPGALKHSRSHDALSYISSSETSAFSHVTARKDVPPTQLRSSKTYYDDTHTIPRQHNLSSTDHSNQSSTARISRRSRDGNDDKSRRHRHRKRSSRD
uniref:FERM domain-containing protein n=1 Tax=Ciona savignyi TaxID=51511 RepID=H2YZ83_CIOSA